MHSSGDYSTTNVVKTIILEHLMNQYRLYAQNDKSIAQKQGIFQSSEANDLYQHIYKEQLTKYEEIMNPRAYYNAEQALDHEINRQQQKHTIGPDQNEPQSYDIELILSKLLNQEYCIDQLNQLSETRQQNQQVVKQREIKQSNKKVKVEMISAKEGERNQKQQQDQLKDYINRLIKDKVHESIIKLVQEKKKRKKGAK